MARKPFSFNQFDGANPTSRLFEKIMRDAVDYTKEIDDVFDAIVLTEPTLASDNADAIISNKVKSQQEKDSSKVTNYIFIVRIIGPDSPHNFLPDPIDFYVTNDKECKIRYHNLLQLHTKVSAKGVTNQELPSKGDQVQIKLKKSDYVYDTQWSRDFMGIISRAAANSEVKKRLQENARGAFKGGKIVGPVVSLKEQKKYFDENIILTHHPVPGKLLKNANFFNQRSYGNHGAIDIGGSADAGTPVRAAHDGTVRVIVSKCESELPTFIGDNERINLGKDCGHTRRTACGNYLDVVHKDGWYTRYCHLQKAGMIRSGTQVKGGQIVGRLGATGNVSGAHLHFVLKAKNGKSLHPGWHFTGVHETVKQKIANDIIIKLPNTTEPVPKDPPVEATPIEEMTSEKEDRYATSDSTAEPLESSTDEGY